MIDAAHELTTDGAARLAAARHPGAKDAANRVWRGWMAGREAALRDFSRVLAVGLRPASPVGDALSVLGSVLTRSARERAPEVLGTDRDGDLTIAEPWYTAEVALREAALGLGAPDFASAGDREVLTAAWRSVSTAR